MDRFEMPHLMREFLSLATKNGTIDAAEMWSLALNHRTDWSAIRTTVMEYAHLNRHSPIGTMKHSELCVLNDECYRVLVMGREPTILFD